MLDKLWDFIDNFFDIFKRLADWVLDGIIEIISSILYFIMDALLTVLEAIIGSIDFASSLTTNFAQWANLPDQLIWLLNRLNLNVILTMLAGAVLIRVTLNLIPGLFSRI